MSEELKQAISALQCAKRGHCDHAMADEAIAALEALTQRPQAVRPDTARCIKARNDLNAALHGGGALIDDLEHAVANVCAKLLRPQAVPMTDDLANEFAREMVKGGRSVEWLVRKVEAHHGITQRPAAQEMPDAVEHYGTVDDLPAAQATPEPVGEALQFPPMPEGWPARFRCDSCDGNGEIGELVSSGHFQPPERQTCPDCGGRGWTSEEHAFNADHMREFAEAHALLTRPAPGVPEGWTVSAYKAAGLTIQSMAQLKGPDLWKIADAAGNVLNKQGEWEWEPMPSSRDDAFLARCRYATLAEASAALAAAQAKGADK